MTTEKPRPAATAEQRDAWLQKYTVYVTVTDFVVIAWAVLGSQLAWFGTERTTLGATAQNAIAFAVNYGAISVALVIAWMIALAGGATRDSTVIGVGIAEYSRVLNATLKLFGVFAIVVFLLGIDVARGFIATAFPSGLLVLLATRWMWRQWLDVKRRAGTYSASAMLVGSRETVEHIAGRLDRQPEAGYRVVGVCIPGAAPDETFGGGQIPVFTTVEEVVDAMEVVGADTLIVTSSDYLTPARLRVLSWSLEPRKLHLIVAPALTDVGGPRIRTRPVAGLPLIHVETPRFEGGQRPTKRVFDVVAASGILLGLALPLLVIAALVRLTSSGPALFTQQRIGRNGTPFTMLKFRSMVDAADTQLDTLAGLERVQPDSVMFKLRGDPRVTPLGRILRRFSIDELPQLLNVLRGEMSLVGPRPPLPSEVIRYETHVHRRFLVQPGLTGLWQVSGRSDLSWDDTVRLDLYYVENWSLATDTVILFRTIKAVFARTGVY